MSTAYFDTHCHLQDERFGTELEAVIARGLAAGVTHLVTCGTEESDWAAVMALARRHSCVIPSLGLHPWFIEKATPNWFRVLEREVSERTVGIGECGLDFALESSDREGQESVFKAQLGLAREANRPVSIHCRKAWARLEALVREVGVPEAGAVVHSFSGSAEVALMLQRLGLHLSFSCALANPTHKRSARAIRAVSLDHLLFETDAPDMAPAATLNEPANIRFVAQAAAQLRSQEEGLLAEFAYRNAMRVFETLLQAR